MGLKVNFDIASIIYKIEAVGRDATNAAFAALKQGGKDIRDTAREFAPVDDHDLEKAIKEQSTKAEKTVWIGIDPTAYDEHGKSVAEYGAKQHALLEIGGDGRGTLRLGPKSRSKDAGRGIVGGGFMTRAFKHESKTILRKTAIKVKRVYSGRGGGGFDEGDDE